MSSEGQGRSTSDMDKLFLIEHIKLPCLEGDRDELDRLNIKEEILFTPSNVEEDNYRRVFIKSYTSVAIKEEPIENIKTLFKTCLLKYEKQTYHQQIFKELIEKSDEISLKDLQTEYITYLRQAAYIEVLTCALCNYQTMNLKMLKCHFVVNHRGKMEHEVFQCNICNYETNFPSQITRHLTKHETTGIKKETEVKEDSKEREKYPCTECNYKGRSEDGLKRHMALHKDKTKCDLCTFESQNRNTLKEHKNNHKIGDKYQCYMCTYNNKNKLPLAQHLIKVHEITNEASKRSKICEICSKSFSSIHQLKVHYVTHKSLTEMDDKEIYKCNQCDHKTKYKANFKLHMLVHKAPEYICDMCGFASKHRYSYENHLITHKKISEIDWYKCSICPYKCRTKSQIRHHIKKGIHSDKNLRHIRNRDRIREAEEKGEVFIVKKKPKRNEEVEPNMSNKMGKLKRKKKVKSKEDTSNILNFYLPESNILNNKIKDQVETT